MLLNSRKVSRDNGLGYLKESLLAIRSGRESVLSTTLAERRRSRRDSQTVD